MTALSNYAENKLLDHLLGTASWTVPTNTFAQLHTGDPGEDCTANVAATSTRNQLSWAAAASRAIATNTDEVWTAGGNETISHVSIWDAASGGNPIAYGPLAAPIPVNTSDTFTISSGNIDLDFTTIASSISTYAGNAALDHMTGRAAWTMPTGIWVQLHTGAPGLAGTSNVATSNDRVSSGTWSAAAAGTTDNDAAISWTAEGNETISHYTLWDANAAGNNLWGAALTASKAVTTGQTARFAAGTLDLSLA